jgi:DNA-binding SARP family transcriptional activator/predicted ATPase
MARLGIRLFGSFEIKLDGEPVTGFASDKVRALLAYLAATADRSHRRETLAGLLWPEYPERSARAALRNALANLRRVIGDRDASPPFLEITRQAIQFNSESDYWLDLTAFSDLLTAKGATSEELEEAVSLYQGPFLEGFSLADSAAYEEWLTLEREQCSRQVLEILYRLVEMQEQSGAYEQALAHAWRQVELEPWREEGQRQVIRLLALTGRRSEALAQYERCRQLLQDELGAEPAAETTALYEAIRSGQVTREATTPVREGAPPSFRQPAPIYNLPPQPTPFIGREKELAALETLLADPTARLVTILGPGGIGKTRLALAAGARIADAQSSLSSDLPTPVFPHGVVFVPLAPLSSVQDMAPAIAQALRLRLDRGQDQLLDYLRQKQLLLILDNVEHLIDGESLRLLTDVLAAAPEVRMMITTRARLNMRREYLFPLSGMDIPQTDSIARWQRPVERAEAYGGIQLFLHCARRLKPDLELGSENLLPIADICQSVQGMPLGIELAAAWVTVLDPEEIAVKIKQSLGFLETTERDVPERQRSMRAVCDSSWSLLTEGERQAVQRLSVFRGGFDRDGAEHAGGVPLKSLSALINKCWIQREAGRRYQIHELLRQYGAERLARDPDLEAAVRDQHSRYYCDWLSQQEKGISNAEQPPAWDAIQDDIENVRAACMWAATQGRPSRLAQTVDALGWFYRLGYGNYQQGELTFRRLRKALAAAGAWPSSATADAQRTLARVLAWEATMWSLLGEQETSKRLLGESLALLDAPTLAGEDTRLERAHIAHQSGYQRMYADPRAGQQCFAESIELYQAIGHKLGLAYALLGLGRSATRVGALGEAREAMTHSISLHRDIGNQVGQSESLAELGGVVVARQLRFQEAEELIRQSLSLTPETNRFGIAYGLGFLGEIQLLTGRFAEVEVSILECMAIFEDLGWQVWAIRRSIVLARARLHAGEYRAARIQAERTVSLAREVGWGRGVSYAKLVLGEVALVEANYAQAYRTLQESLLGLKEFADEPWDVNQSAWLGLAARGLERRLEAWQHLVSALEWASKYRGFMELMVALTGIALFLADDGEAERALEVYALAAQQPLVANSRWFVDVAGREIAAVAASLPPDVVAAAQARGQETDLWQAGAELLKTLRRRFGPNEKT